MTIMKPAPTPTALDEAKRLPPPTAGLDLMKVPFPVAVEYLKLYDLEIIASEGTRLIVRRSRKPSDSPLGIAQQLAKIGEAAQ